MSCRPHHASSQPHQSKKPNDAWQKANLYMNKSIVILPGTELESGIAQKQCAHLPIRLPVFQSRLLLHTPVIHLMHYFCPKQPMPLPPPLCPNLGHKLLLNFIHCDKLSCIPSCHREQLCQVWEAGPMNTRRCIASNPRCAQSARYTEPVPIDPVKQLRTRPGFTTIPGILLQELILLLILLESHCNTRQGYFLEVQAGAAERT